MFKQANRSVVEEVKFPLSNMSDIANAILIGVCPFCGDDLEYETIDDDWVSCSRDTGHFRKPLMGVNTIVKIEVR